MKPVRKGAVLQVCQPVHLCNLICPLCDRTNHTQGRAGGVLYSSSGEGKITAGKKTSALYAGICVLIPAGLEFTMQNTGAEPLTMYLINEPIPARGFRPNKDMLVVDENTTPSPIMILTGWDWSKHSLIRRMGLEEWNRSLPVLSAPILSSSHTATQLPAEEVWVAMNPNTHVLLGKQIRLQDIGTAFLVPPDNKTPHANFNLSENTVKLFYFARYQDHEREEVKEVLRNRIFYMGEPILRGWRSLTILLHGIGQIFTVY